MFIYVVCEQTECHYIPIKWKSKILRLSSNP